VKAYVKTYIKHFNYCEQDYIPSEISGSPAVDIHHIKYGRYKRDDSIENLIALTREEHNLAHEKKLSEEYLQKIHLDFLDKLKQG